MSAPDRVVVTRADGSQEVIKDEVALLRQPGSTVATENFDDGSSRTIVTRADGSRVVTIRDADLRVLRRTLVSPDGTQTRLIDDTAEVEPVDVATLPAPAPVYSSGTYNNETALREALRSEVDLDRRFTLGQVRSIPEVRSLVAPINIDAITFDSGSAAISPDQAQQLSTLGNVIQDAIAEDPREVFLIEGHTDLVGPDAANLALSDRRAESVALALSEYFQVPPENLIVQGYGEQYPQIRREGDIRENRRATIRRITSLLQTADGE
nr:OmpA family protein [Paracoccus aerius]